MAKTKQQHERATDLDAAVILLTFLEHEAERELTIRPKADETDGGRVRACPSLDQIEQR